MVSTWGFETLRIDIKLSIGSNPSKYCQYVGVLVTCNLQETTRRKVLSLLNPTSEWQKPKLTPQLESHFPLSDFQQLFSSDFKPILSAISRQFWWAKG